MMSLYKKCVEDFSKIYAVTDEKFKEDEFNKQVKKENQMVLQKVLKLDIFFILVINIQNQ